MNGSTISILRCSAPRAARWLANNVWPALALLVLIAAMRSAAAETPLTSIASSVGLDQRLGEQVPLDLEFRDEAGRSVRLSKYFGAKPVVLTLVYYRCPMLCTQVLNGLLHTAQAIPLAIDDDYDIVTVSFDERETPELAAAKKASYVRVYRRSGAERGWHFLTGDRHSIERLARSVGFRYRYDRASDQFAHASGIIVLTPEGRVSRYFYGIDFRPQDLRLGLVESSSGKIGSKIDQLLLLCFHYDPSSGRYNWAVGNALRLAGAATVLGLGGFLVVMFRQERRRSLAVRNQQRDGAAAIKGPDW